MPVVFRRTGPWIQELLWYVDCHTVSILGAFRPPSGEFCLELSHSCCTHLTRPNSSDPSTVFCAQNGRASKMFAGWTKHPAWLAIAIFMMSAFFLFPSSLSQGLPLVSSGVLTMQTYIPLTEMLNIGVEEGPCSCVLTGSSSVGLGAHISSLVRLLTETDSCFLSRSYTVMKGDGKGPEGLFRLNPLYHKWQNEGLTKWRGLLVSGRAEIKKFASLWK